MHKSAGIQFNAPFPQPPAWAEERKQLIVCSAEEMKEAGPTTGKAIELHEGGKLSALKTELVSLCAQKAHYLCCSSQHRGADETSIS